MAGFVAANLLCARVCSVVVAYFGEVGGREVLDALLVEGIDNSFRREQALEQEVIRIGYAVVDRRNWLGKAGGERVGNVAIA